MTNLSSVSAAGISLSNNSGKVVTSKDQQALDKDAFLKLLAAQAKTQDPMNPTDSSQQIAQLAQFSALEQMLNVSNEMAKLRTISNSQSAVQLVGRTVSYIDPATGSPTTGVVEKVSLASPDGPTLTVAGKEGVLLSAVSEVQ